MRTKARPTWWVGLVAFVTGVMAQVIAHRVDAVHAFWDAQAHLDIARRVVDSITPGLQMLGTVWLPVPHLLYLPFTLVDAWWWNGLAGGIVGLAAFVATAVAVFQVASRRIGSGWPAFTAAGVVICNPSLLYLQATAMTEPLLLGCIAVSVAALDRWWDTPDAFAPLWVAGVFAALAVGSRYDGWFYVTVAVPVVAWRARRLGGVARFACAPALMVALWLWYNWHYFGDPLEFQRGIWSAAAQQAALAERGLLPTRGAPLTAIAYYLGAIGITCGWGVLVVGAIGSLGALRTAARWGVGLLGAALAFNVIALVMGQSVIALPWTTPAGILNVRYGVMVLPMLALGAGFLARGARARPALLVVAMVQLVAWGWRWPVSVGAVREALAIRDGDRAQMDASIWLQDHYDRGRILITPLVNVSPRSRIPMRDRIYPWSWQLGDSALADPAGTVDWVLVDRRVPDDPVNRAVVADTAFGRRFVRAFEQRGLEIWQRR